MLGDHMSGMHKDNDISKLTYHDCIQKDWRIVTFRSFSTRMGFSSDRLKNLTYKHGLCLSLCVCVCSDPTCLLRDPGEAAGERGDSDQRVLHHRELQGLHHAAGIGNQTHRAQEDGGHVAGGENEFLPRA